MKERSTSTILGSLSTFSALLSAVAVIGAAVATWMAYNITEQGQKDYRNRTQFHFEIDNKIDWTIVAFQISGDPYHIPRINITPIFEDASGRPRKGQEIFKTLIPQKSGGLPYYRISNLRNQVCRTQKCGQDQLSSLIIRYSLYETERNNEASMSRYVRALQKNHIFSFCVAMWHSPYGLLSLRLRRNLLTSNEPLWRIELSSSSFDRMIRSVDQNDPISQHVGEHWIRIF